jgi:hypothetical protein
VSRKRKQPSASAFELACPLFRSVLRMKDPRRLVGGGKQACRDRKAKRGVEHNRLRRRSCREANGKLGIVGKYSPDPDQNGAMKTAKLMRKSHGLWAAQDHA